MAKMWYQNWILGMQKWIASNTVLIIHIILDTHRPWAKSRWHSWSCPRAPSKCPPPTAWSPSWLQSSGWGPWYGGRRASSHSRQGGGRGVGCQGRLHVKSGPIISSQLFLEKANFEDVKFQFESPIKSATQPAESSTHGRNGRELLFPNCHGISHCFFVFQHCWMTKLLNFFINWRPLLFQNKTSCMRCGYFIYP